MGDVRSRGLVARRVHQPRGAQGEQPRLIDLDPRFGDIGADRALLGQRPAERDPAPDARTHGLERALGHADQPHAVMDAPRTEAALRDLEAAALAEEHVSGRHTNLLEHDLGVPVRGIVEAEHRQHALDAHARGVHRDEDHRLLLMLRRIGVAATHEDRNTAARVTRAGDPPLAAVNHILVILPSDAGADVGGVRRRDVWLGHRKAGANLAGEQRLEPLPLLFGRAIPHQHLHVAGVGRRAVEHLGREARRASHDLAERRVLQIGQAGAVFAVRQEQVPEAVGSRLLLQRLDDGGRLPAIAGGNFRLEARFVRIDVRVHECGETRLQLLHLRWELEVHETHDTVAARSSWFRTN